MPLVELGGGDAAIWVGDSVESHRFCRVALAVVETPVVVAWHVPEAAHNIVDVLAEGGGVRAILTATNAELVEGDKVGPFVQLLQLPAERA